MIEIPLTSDPEQLFEIVVNNTTYGIRIILNSRTDKWTISLSSNGEDIVTGIVLLSGIDLIDQYNIIGLDPMFIINVDSPNEDVTKTGLGSDWKLFSITQEEIDNASAI